MARILALRTKIICICTKKTEGNIYIIYILFDLKDYHAKSSYEIKFILVMKYTYLLYFLKISVHD